MEATKLLLSLTRINFAVAISSRAVRISSRAVGVFPALSLRRVWPSYGTFSRIFQGNCARGRTGHMINIITLLCSHLLKSYDCTRMLKIEVINFLVFLYTCTAIIECFLSSWTQISVQYDTSLSCIH